MRDYADTVLSHLDRREVQYADVRVVDSRERNLATKNGKVGTTSSDESLGLGVRVLSQGCWGFASTDDLSKESLAAVAANYIEANESVSRKDFALRIKIARKEAKESHLWLRLCEMSDDGLRQEQQLLLAEALELCKIFGSILEKVKSQG